MIIDNNIYKFNFFNHGKVVHGVSTRRIGSIKNNKKINYSNLEKFLTLIGKNNKKAVFPEQVHGSSISYVNKTSDMKIIRGVDGLITAEKDVILCTVTADCLPLIFFDEKKEIIGVTHAGYKGILLDIVENMINHFKLLKSDVRDIKVGIGPSIGGCCYDVSLDRINLFKEKFKGYKKIYRVENNKHLLDLKKVVFQNFLSLGIKKKNIEISNVCTKCNSKEFFSYRTDTKENYGEFVSVIGLR